MSTRAYELRQKIAAAIPPDELFWVVMSRISLKCGVRLGTITSEDELPEEELRKAARAASELLGLSLYV